MTIEACGKSVLSLSYQNNATVYCKCQGCNRIHIMHLNKPFLCECGVETTIRSRTYPELPLVTTNTYQEKPRQQGKQNMNVTTKDKRTKAQLLEEIEKMLERLDRRAAEVHNNEKEIRELKSELKGQECKTKTERALKESLQRIMRDIRQSILTALALRHPGRQITDEIEQVWVKDRYVDVEDNKDVPEELALLRLLYKMSLREHE